jgi:hypothetical protein
MAGLQGEAAMRGHDCDGRAAKDYIADGTSRPIHRSTTPAHKASSQVPVNGGAEHPALHIHTILGEPLARKRIGLQAHDSKGGSKAS